MDHVGEALRADYAARHARIRAAARFLAARGCAVFRLHGIVHGLTGIPTGCTCGVRLEPATPECLDPTRRHGFGKHPARAAWQHESTGDPAQIDRWWPAAYIPACGIAGVPFNLGIDCAKSHLAAFDIDRHIATADGFETFAAFEAHLGRAIRGDTWGIRTGGGGQDVLFDTRHRDPLPKFIGSLKNLFGPGVDIRQAGNLIVGPGSAHISAETYEFVHSEDGSDPRELDPQDPRHLRPLPIPDDVVEVLTKQHRAPAGPVHGTAAMTLLGQVALRAGLMRVDAGDRLGIWCPFGRDGRYPFPDDHSIADSSDLAAVVWAASGPSRVGYFSCLHSKCDGRRTPEAVLARFRQLPDGQRWIAEADRVLDAAGIAPLSTSFRPRLPDDPSAPQTVVLEDSHVSQSTLDAGPPPPPPPVRPGDGDANEREQEAAAQSDAADASSDGGTVPPDAEHDDEHDEIGAEDTVSDTDAELPGTGTDDADDVPPDDEHDDAPDDEISAGTDDTGGPGDAHDPFDHDADETFTPGGDDVPPDAELPPDEPSGSQGTGETGGAGNADRSTPWGRAQTAAEFLAEADQEILWLVERLLAPGCVTEWFSPRGLGKTQVSYALAVKLAKAGYRVLLLDRDNPRREIKRRWRAWDAAGLTTVKILTRQDVPPLTDAAAWRTFPCADYDLVILDSWDAASEGVGEQDSSKPSRAVAVVLDIARRTDGPAMLVLGNTIKSGAHGRGSGVLEDRAEITYEVRDATDFTPSGRKSWVEELPNAGRAAWAERSGRRKRRERYRLAFINTKCRIGEEPDPFVLEIDLSAEPWQLREVTAEMEAAGAAAQEAERQARAEREAAAVARLTAEIARREAAAEPPLMTTAAIGLLQAMMFTQKAARILVRAGDGIHWRLEPVAGKGNPVVLRPIDNSEGQRKSPNPESPAAEGLQEGLFTSPAPGAATEIPCPENPCAARASEGGVFASPFGADPGSQAGVGGNGDAPPVRPRCPKCSSTDWTPAAPDRPGLCAGCGPVVGLDGGPDAADAVAQAETNASAPLTTDERRQLEQEAQDGDPLARRLLGLPPTRDPDEEG